MDLIHCKFIVLNGFGQNPYISLVVVPVGAWEIGVFGLYFLYKSGDLFLQ